MVDNMLKDEDRISCFKKMAIPEKLNYGQVLTDSDKRLYNSTKKFLRIGFFNENDSQLDKEQKEEAFLKLENQLLLHGIQNKVNKNILIKNVDCPELEKLRMKFRERKMKKHFKNLTLNQNQFQNIKEELLNENINNKIISKNNDIVMQEKEYISDMEDKINQKKFSHLNSIRSNHNSNLLHTESNSLNKSRNNNKDKTLLTKSSFNSNKVLSNENYPAFQFNSTENFLKDFNNCNNCNNECQSILNNNKLKTKNSFHSNDIIENCSNNKSNVCIPSNRKNNPNLIIDNSNTNTDMNTICNSYLNNQNNTTSYVNISKIGNNTLNNNKHIMIKDNTLKKNKPKLKIPPLKNVVSFLPINPQATSKSPITTPFSTEPNKHIDETPTIPSTYTYTTSNITSIPEKKITDIRLKKTHKRYISFNPNELYIKSPFDNVQNPNGEPNSGRPNCNIDFQFLTLSNKMNQSPSRVNFNHSKSDKFFINLNNSKQKTIDINQISETCTETIKIGNTIRNKLMPFTKHVQHNKNIKKYLMNEDEIIKQKYSVIKLLDYEKKNLIKKANAKKVFMKNKNNNRVDIIDQAKANLMNYCDNYTKLNDTEFFRMRKAIFSEYPNVQKEVGIKTEENEKKEEEEEKNKEMLRYKKMRDNDFELRKMAFNIERDHDIVSQNLTKYNNKNKKLKKKEKMH